MWTKVVAWWSSLPHLVQAGLTLFAGGVFGVVEPVIQQWASGQTVCTVAVGLCVKGYLISALKAGVMAVIGLYLPSSFHKK